MNTEKNYYIEINNEPEIVKEIRFNILDKFKDLVFKEDTHQYFWHDKELAPVSTFIHQYEPEFDSITISERYAKANGQTPEYWRDKWKWNSLIATTTGTLVHEFGESLGWLINGHPELITDSCIPKYVKEKGWLIPTRDKEDSVISYMRNLPSGYHLVLNEARVVNEYLGYAGTFDILYYFDGLGNPDKAGLIIEDYKTNKDLYKLTNREKNVRLLQPFDYMYDEPVNKYTLQQSSYQIPLEDMGYRVIGRYLIWIKNNGFERVFVPDVSREIRVLPPYYKG